MPRYRFLDVRTSPPTELWLKQASGGYFYYQKGIYTQKVLKLVGIHHAPQVKQLDPLSTPPFGRPAEVTLVDRATRRRRR